MFLTYLYLLILVAVNLRPAMGKVNNDPTCPETRPEIGSVCSLPKGVGCRYKPYTCPESETAFLVFCACNSDGTFVCAESTPPTCQCPDSEPISLGNNGRCTLGTKCRYNPVGCVDGIKFANNCECILHNGKNTYLCDSKTISCEPHNDADCPAEPDFGGTCDPTKVNRCEYTPYGCPGKTDGEFFIYDCECEAASKQFICFAASMLPCSEQTTTDPDELCFPGDSMVTTGTNGEQVRLDRLEIGDRVLVGTNRFESVYSFGHRDPDRIVEYLEITTEANSTLRISADHMVWTLKSFAPAWHLRIGDELMDGPSGKPVVIASIRNVLSKGAYAPFTPSGTIVVDGVLASSFVSLSADDSIEIAGGFELSMQWMARMSEFPHRVVCHYLGSCPNEVYDKFGVSTWNALPLRVGQWVMARPSGTLRGSLLSAFAGLLGVFWLLENRIVVATLVVGAIMFVYGKKVKKAV